MRYNLAAIVKTPLGKDMFEQVEETVKNPETGVETLVPMKKIVTIGNVFATIIFAETEDEQRQPNPKMKLQRFAIGQRLVAAIKNPSDSQWVDLNLEETNLLRAIAGKVCSINLFGQISAFLEAPVASPAGVPGVTE